MQLPALFDPRACVTQVRAAGKAAALKLAAQQLARRLRAGPGAGVPAGLTAGAIEAALVAREERGSTGFGAGMAIPHARMAGIPAMVGAVLKLERPVPFGSFDGAPVWLLVALAGPDGGGAAHLKAMARIARVLRTDGARLKGADNGQALYALMTGALMTEGGGDGG